MIRHNLQLGVIKPLRYRRALVDLGEFSLHLRKPVEVILIFLLEQSQVQHYQANLVAVQQEIQSKFEESIV
jgi:hypothetical protein